MDARALFKRAFAHAPPEMIRVPASADLLGGHTEAHSGLVVTAAVDRFVEIGFVPRGDGRIELVGEHPERRVTLWPRECEPGEAPGWAAPLAAVVRHLREIGGLVRGFNAAWSSTIPAGAGFGEQAALTLAGALALRRMFPFALGESGLGAAPRARRDGGQPSLGLKDCARFAEFCHAAEAGMHSGEDRMHAFVAPLVNRAYGTSQWDGLHRLIERHPLPGALALVFCDTSMRDERHGLHRARFEAAGRSAARRLGLKTLRSLEVGDVNRVSAGLSGPERGAARFVAGECARVVAAERALRLGDAMQFGECLFQSHAAAREEAGLTAPELDLLVAAAREHHACVGARFTGSGSGGGTLNLVSWTQLDSFVRHQQERFHTATGRDLNCLSLKPVAGVFG